MRPRRESHDAERSRNRNPGAAEQAGEAVGGVTGVLIGAGIGTAAGPIGALLGGVAGAAGGWWVGEKAGRAIEDIDEHEQYYHTHWEAHRRPDMDYETARIGYGLGHIAGRNPDYAGMPFAEIEDDLRRGWTYDRWAYETMRPYVRAGYEHTMRH